MTLYFKKHNSQYSSQVLQCYDVDYQNLNQGESSSFIRKRNYSQNQVLNKQQQKLKTLLRPSSKSSERSKQSKISVHFQDLEENNPKINKNLNKTLQNQKFDQIEQLRNINNQEIVQEIQQYAINATDQSKKQQNKKTQNLQKSKRNSENFGKNEKENQQNYQIQQKKQQQQQQQKKKDFLEMNMNKVKQVNKFQEYLQRGLEQEKKLIAMQEERIKDDNYLFAELPYTKEAMKMAKNDIFVLKIDDGIIDYNLNNFKSSKRKCLPIKIDPKYKATEISYDKQKKRKQIQEQFLIGKMNIEKNSAEFFENFEIQNIKSPRGIVSKIDPDSMEDNLILSQNQNSYQFLNQELKLGFTKEEIEKLKHQDEQEQNSDIFTQQNKLNMFQKNQAYINYFKQLQKSKCENMYIYQKELLNKKYNKNNNDEGGSLTQDMQLGFQKKELTQK
ncbi:hypothetical protein PPERSA_01000 [Pseudocohnilembus persalinus]|uniref:Uncharacterized protein n=1 Tax=Pseudocohnilembus persalinus TaxID=266149 RepID=A0A0V0Q7B3_PSEPJ|nr:hypothetical protein PPERSA_01000 [Pseudocohnilembus persalinus]|eukprot:KRW98130.1 hypothetical protein PPERSA_01000 [Pseudocohnilembus persalinus]